MEGTYRFFANDKVTPELILSKHFECTRARCSQQSIVLLIQDTTEVDLTQLTEQMDGAGPLDNNHRFGAFVHPLLAMDGNGVPLGFAWAKMWARELQQPDLQTVSTAATAPETASSHDAAQVTSNTAPSNTAALPEVAALTKAEQKKIRDRAKEKNRKHTPIENKESIRWIESVREARKVAEACPNTTCICIADSEGDIFELFSESRATSHARPLDLLMPCDVVFDASEWKAVYMVRHKTSPPEVPPTLNMMIRWIAAMGGHVIRSTTKENHPGTQTLWLGLQRVNDLATAWNSYGPGKTITNPQDSTPQKRCVVR